MTAPRRPCIARAARLTAAIRADDRPGMSAAWAEVKGDPEATRQLVVALGVRVVQLAALLYGENSKQVLDDWAFDAITFETQPLRPHPRPESPSERLTGPARPIC